MILVAGGTGTLGTELVRRLAARGARVRVLSRNAAAKQLAGPEVEVVQGDVRDRASLERAATGVATVISAVHGFLDKVGPSAIDGRGQARSAIDVGGPEDLSFVDFGRAVEEATGKKGATSHVPLPMMRAMAVLMKPMNPMLARQIQGGVVMDTTDLTFATVKRHSISWIQGTTTLREVVVRDYS